MINLLIGPKPIGFILILTLRNQMSKLKHFKPNCAWANPEGVNYNLC